MQHSLCRLIKTTSLYLLIAFSSSGAVFAGDLVYTPKNPSFGGNAANGGYLLGLANAQKQFEQDRDEDSNLEKFNERLQSSLLSRITSAVTRDIVDIEGNITPGYFETIDYIINITDNGDGTVTIETTDKVTGDQTSLQVQSST